MSGITLKATTEAAIPTPAADKATIFLDADSSNEPAFKDEAGIVTSLRGDTGSTGATGPTGPTGPGYAATSSTSLTPSIASKVFTTQAGLAYLAGTRMKAISAGNSAIWMEGLVTAYTGTTLTATMDRIGTASAASDWNIGVAGDQGDTGATGSAGATGSPGATGATGPAGSTLNPAAFVYAYNTFR